MAELGDKRTGLVGLLQKLSCIRAKGQGCRWALNPQMQALDNKGETWHCNSASWGRGKRKEQEPLVLTTPCFRELAPVGAIVC